MSLMNDPDGFCFPKIGSTADRPIDQIAGHVAHYNEVDATSVGLGPKSPTLSQRIGLPTTCTRVGMHVAVRVSQTVAANQSIRQLPGILNSERENQTRTFHTKNE